MPATACLTSALLAALLLGVFGVSSTAAAAAAEQHVAPSSAASDASCFTLRLKERNLPALYQAIGRASGLGQGAGEYLTPAQVAALTGRSRHDIRRLQDFATGLGGSLQHVSLLRDTATLCLGLAAAQKLLAAGTPPAPARRRLLLQGSGTAEGEPSMLAAALVQALPSRVAGMLHFLTPATPPRDSDPPPRRKLQASRHGRELQAKRQRGTLTPGSSETAAALEPVQSVQYSLDGLDIPGPSSIGPDVTLDFGRSDTYGTLFTFGEYLVVPTFPLSSPLLYLGLFSPSELLDSTVQSASPLAFMMPCSWDIGDGSTPTNISFATAADVANGTCSAVFSGTFTASFAAFGGASAQGTTSQASSAMRRMRCGDAVARSASATSPGALPSDFCASLSSQVAFRLSPNGIGNDISNDTLIFIYNASAAGLPSFTPIVQLTLGAKFSGTGLPGPLQASGLSSSTATSVFSVTGPNTPAYLRHMYNVPPGRGAAKGLMAAVSSYAGNQYVYSPADLAIANQALGVSVPIVASLINPNATSAVFAPNDPTHAYGSKKPIIDLNVGSLQEAALDLQILTQFGDGSGISFGFVASNASGSAYNSQIAAANLDLQPLPDILSWSYSSTNSEFSTYTAESLLQAINEQRATNAVLAKFAAMGITVLAASGDSGFSTGPSNCAQAYLTPQSPAASPFVTAVGAVMESYTRPPTSPSSPPELVTCMSAAGGAITSGGGFGNFGDFADPDLFAWQREAVTAYIASQQNSSTWPSTTQLQNSGAAYCPPYNNGVCSYGRGYPDLALLGSPTPIMASGRPDIVAGTSVSTPAMAGLVAQINAAIRAVPGLENSRIGFMNPFLYWAAAKFPDAFTDVTKGSNQFPVEFSNVNCGLGYAAAPGWDATTGLGVPNAAVLQRAAVEYVITQQKAARRHRRRGA